MLLDDSHPHDHPTTTTDLHHLLHYHLLLLLLRVVQRAGGDADEALTVVPSTSCREDWTWMMSLIAVWS